MSLTYDQALQAHGWAPKSIGLINVGAIIGSILGSAYAVIIGDWIVLWLARRNNGIHKPEHRIIVLIPVAIVGFAMILLYAFTVQGSSSWWGIVLSYTFYN